MVSGRIPARVFRPLRERDAHLRGGSHQRQVTAGHALARVGHASHVDRVDAGLAVDRDGTVATEPGRRAGGTRGADDPSGAPHEARNKQHPHLSGFAAGPVREGAARVLHDGPTRRDRRAAAPGPEDRAAGDDQRRERLARRHVRPGDYDAQAVLLHRAAAPVRQRHGDLEPRGRLRPSAGERARTPRRIASGHHQRRPGKTQHHLAARRPGAELPPDGTPPAGRHRPGGGEPGRGTRTVAPQGSRLPVAAAL